MQIWCWQLILWCFIMLTFHKCGEPHNSVQNMEIKLRKPLAPMIFQRFGQFGFCRIAKTCCALLHEISPCSRMRWNAADCQKSSPWFRCIKMAGSIKIGGTSSHHAYVHGIFHEINHLESSYLGTPMTWETSKSTTGATPHNSRGTLAPSNSFKMSKCPSLVA